jgi:hypothetical protein
MKISYAITVCNELEEVKELINFLHLNKRSEDKICVLLDKPKASPELIDQLHRFSSSNWITLKESSFQNHFSDWKNELIEMCDGDFIFQIDADELPHENLITNLPSILEHNLSVDLYAVPRVNTVKGLTQEHIAKWRWNVNEKGWVNWPDFQTRIYKNDPEIKWINKVHERISGHKQFAYIPMEEEWALYHPKTIERQEKQNNYYNTL